MVGVAWWTCALLAVAAVRARLYERCELALDLQRLCVDKEDIPTWVCIAYHESRLDTAAINLGSGDHGLLQISELYWCGPGKACGAPCSAFRDDDITDDIECALQIYEEHARLQGDGFLAWVVYPLFCKYVTKKYLADCDSYLKNHTHKTLNEPRARSYDNFNSSSHRSINTSLINDSSTSYLTINSIIRDSVRHSPPGSFLKFKVDNIDDLKLPVFILRTTTTPRYYDTTSVATTSISSVKRRPINHEYKTKVTTPISTETDSFRYHTFSSTVAPAKSVVYSTKLNATEKETDHFQFKIIPPTFSSVIPTQLPNQTSSPNTQITATTLGTTKHNYSSYQGARISRPKNVTFQYSLKPKTMSPFYRTSPLFLHEETTTSRPASQLRNQVIESTPQPPISTLLFKLPTTTRPIPAYTSIRPQTTKPTTSFGYKEKLQSFKSEGTTSIFDLYLNPTKILNVVTFQIPALESWHNLKIFSGGTTAAPKLFGSQDDKVPAAGGSAGNNLYRRDV